MLNLVTFKANTPVRAMDEVEPFCPICMHLLEEAVEAGATVESLREFAKTCRTWRGFREGIQDFLDEHGEPD